MRYLLLFTFLVLVPGAFGQDYHELKSSIRKKRLYRDSTIWSSLDSLIIKSAKDKNLQEELSARILKGEIFFTFSEYKEGLDYLEKLTPIIMEKGHQGNQYYLNNALAQAHLLNTNYANAVDHALYSYKLAKEKKDSSWILKPASKIGHVLLLSGRTEEAAPYLIEALDIAYNKQNKISIIQLSNNLLKANSDKLSKEPYKEYLRKYVQMIDQWNLPINAEHLGLKDIINEKVSTATILKVYESIKLSSFRQGRIDFTEFITDQLLSRGAFEQAIDILKNELQLAQENESILALSNLNSYLANVYAANSDHKKAYYHQQEYYKYNQRIRGENIQTRIDSLQVLFETAEKDRLLAKNDLILARKQKQNQLLLLSTISLFFLTAIIIYLTRRRAKLKEKIIRQDKLITEQRLKDLENENKILAMDYMLLGEEKERKRIAQELHDSLGSLLSSAQMQLRKLEERDIDRSDSGFYKKASFMLQDAAREVRRISHDMMPEALVNLGLQASIEDLMLQISNDTGLDAQYYFSGIKEEGIPEKIKMAFFRIVQELSQNAIKHSDAEHFIVQVTQSEKSISLVVEDDGKGFDPVATRGSSHGIGIKNIENRVKVLDGKLEISSRPGGPTIFEIEVPL